MKNSINIERTKERKGDWIIVTAGFRVQNSDKAK